MIIALLIMITSTIYLMTKCASSEKKMKDPSSVTPKRVKKAIVEIPLPPHNQPAKEIIPESPVAAHLMESSNTPETHGRSKVGSPHPSQTPVTGSTNPTSEPTPSAGLNNEEIKNAEKHSKYSQVSAELEIHTLTAGPDSLFEKGQTTKTKEPDGSSDYRIPEKKKGSKLPSPKKETSEEKQASKSPLDKEKVKGKEKEKNEVMTSSSGNNDKEDKEEIKEKTSKEPTDEKEKKTGKDDKEEKRTKTKEDKRSIEAKLSTAPTITPLDSTQCSNTRKDPTK